MDQPVVSAFVATETTVTPLALREVLLIEPAVFRDGRGDFHESWQEETFARAVGHSVHFVQDNHSRSGKGTVRGLHYQLPPWEQGKLVRAGRGAIFDVAVDVRRSSPTFGRWVGATLSDDNYLQLWIPPGFAHGYLALTEPADVLYKATALYTPDAAREVRWNDPAIGIDWPIDGDPNLSDRDGSAPLLSDAEIFE